MDKKRVMNVLEATLDVSTCALVACGSVQAVEADPAWSKRIRDTYQASFDLLIAEGIQSDSALQLMKNIHDAAYLEYSVMAMPSADMVEARLVIMGVRYKK